MFLQSLRAHCLAPGGSGSIKKYLEALVRSPGVSGRIACCFRTDLHFADVPLHTCSNEGHTGVVFPNIAPGMPLAIPPHAMSICFSIGGFLIIPSMGLSVTNGSGQPASRPGVDRKTWLVWFLTYSKTRSAASWRAKPGPIPVNPRVLPGLARPVGSKVQFCVLGFVISHSTQIFYS